MNISVNPLISDNTISRMNKKTEMFGINDLEYKEIIIFLKNIINICIFINNSVNPHISDNTLSRMDIKLRSSESHPRKQRNHHFLK